MWYNLYNLKSMISNIKKSDQFVIQASFYNNFNQIGI